MSVSGVCLAASSLGLPAPSQHVCRYPVRRSTRQKQRRAHAPLAAGQRKQPGGFQGKPPPCAPTRDCQHGPDPPVPRPMSIGLALSRSPPHGSESARLGFHSFCFLFFLLHFLLCFPILFFGRPLRRCLWLVGRASNDECGMTSREQTNRVRMGQMNAPGRKGKNGRNGVQAWWGVTLAAGSSRARLAE